MKKSIGLIVSAIVIVALVSIVLKRESDKTTEFKHIVETSEGTQQIEYASALHGLDGSTTTLADYKGKVLILNFWASWCEPCQQEAPELQKFYEKMPDDVAFLGMNVISSENRSNVDKFINMYKLEFPIYLDEGKALETALQVASYPTTFIFDAEGVLHYTVRSPISARQLTELVEEIK